MLTFEPVYMIMCVSVCVCARASYTHCYRQVASQLHYLVHQLFFFLISAVLSELEPKEKRLIRQAA